MKRPVAPGTLVVLVLLLLGVLAGLVVAYHFGGRRPDAVPTPQLVPGGRP